LTTEAGSDLPACAARKQTLGLLMDLLRVHQSVRYEK